MVKSIIKEIIVILLLLAAIILALGVLLYDYLPANKIVPTVATYSTSANVSKELNEVIVENETVLVTYEINSTDLNTYESTKEYTKGKANPFSTYENETEEEESNVTNTNTNKSNTSKSSTNTNTSGGNSSSNTTNTNTNSNTNTNNTTNNTNTNNTFYNTTTK